MTEVQIFETIKTGVMVMQFVVVPLALGVVGVFAVEIAKFVKNKKTAKIISAKKHRKAA